MLPLLGIITVAALLPPNWEIRFCDRNVAYETEAAWEWCDLVILSAMIVQKLDLQALIQKSIRLGKKVAVGGPYPTSVPQEEIRGQFWYQLWILLLRKPQVLTMYLGLCAAGEHFWEYRILARERIIRQLGYDPLQFPVTCELRLIRIQQCF